MHCGARRPASKGMADNNTVAAYCRKAIFQPRARWCLCVTRVLEAYEAGQALRVKLTATRRQALGRN